MRDGNIEGAHVPKYMGVGDGVLYQRGLFHGVKPVTSGHRFSLTFFYDVPDDDKQGTPISVEFINNTTKIAKLAWMRDRESGELEMVESDWVPGSTIKEQTYVGDTFVALSHDERETQLDQWEIFADNGIYILGEAEADVHARS